MGNSIVKDFKEVKLVECGNASPINAIAPASAVLGRSLTVIVKKDDGRKSTIFFDRSTMLPIYITTKRTRGSKDMCITKDSSGISQFLTTDGSKTKRLIYKAPKNEDDLSEIPCTAQIEIDRSGPAVCAFFSIFAWKGDGPGLLSVYKALKISRVRYGVLVMNMQGQVVAKAQLDTNRAQPIIDVAAGTDLASVISLISFILDDF